MRNSSDRCPPAGSRCLVTLPQRTGERGDMGGGGVLDARTREHTHKTHNNTRHKTHSNTRHKTHSTGAWAGNEEQVRERGEGRAGKKSWVEIGGEWGGG